MTTGVGGAAFVVIAVIVFCHREKLKFSRSELTTKSVSFDSSASDLENGCMYFSVTLFSYKELLEATDNFNQSNELGNGGFGTVYYGNNMNCITFG